MDAISLLTQETIMFIGYAVLTAVFTIIPIVVGAIFSRVF